MRRTNIVACTFLFAAATAVANGARSVSNAKASGDPESKPGAVVGDPVGVADGAVYDAVVDVRVSCPDIDLVFRRSYGSWSQRSGSLGIGWTHTYDWRVVTNAQSVYVYSAGERGVTDGTHVFSPPPPVGGSVVNKDGYELRHLGSGRLAVVTPERLTYSFDADGRLSSIQTWNGTGVTVVRDGTSGSVVQARHSDGKSLGFVLDAKGRVVRVTTPAPGVWVEYFYASGGVGDKTNLLSRAVLHDGQTTCVRSYEYEEVQRPGQLSASQVVAAAGIPPSRPVDPAIMWLPPPNMWPTGGGAASTSKTRLVKCHVLSRKTDANGMSTSYSYRREGDDVNEKCVETSMSGGLFALSLSYTRDGRTTCVEAETAFGKVARTYTFDDRKREIGRSVGDESRRNTYDGAGDLVKTVLTNRLTSRSLAAAAAYDSRHRAVATAEAYGAHPVLFDSTEWDDLTGMPRRRVSRAGRVSEWVRGGQSYTVYGAGTNDSRLVSSVSCDSRWRPVSAVDPDGGETRFSYGADGLVSRVEADGLPAVDIGHDALGNVSSVSLPGPDGTNRTVAMSNNWRGSPLSVSYPDGTAESFAYDGNGTKVVRHVDRLGREDAYKWVLGLPVHAGRVIGGVTNTLFGVKHDKQLNVVSITDPLGRAAESYALDENDRVVAVTNVEDQAMTRAYAVGDLVASETRFDGTTVTYDYDAGANLSSVAYPGETLSFSYDADGLLTSVSNSVGVVTNLYDAATGWLDASCGADGAWVAYARSDGGAVTSMTSVAGTTAYSLDAAGRRTHLATPSAAFDFGYCEWNGRLAAVTNADGFVVQYAFDIMDRVTNISWRTTSGATLGGFAYEYDALGRITSRSHSLGTPSHPSQMSQSSQRTYAYDDFDRLASDGDVTYTYDAAGNRMTRTENGETITYTLGIGDRLASYGRAASPRPPQGGAYTHDIAGNVTRIERDGRPTLDLAWNSQYQLVSVSTNGVFAEGYTYDALGRRVSTTTAEGTTRHVYDNNWQCIADIDENGDVIASYTWGEGIDKLLAVTVGGATYYALTDIQGTVWGYVDSQNNIVARWQYDAWGNVLSEEIDPSAAALASLRYRFQGREWSEATGLINFRMRWYDAETGRWLSKDPIGLSGGLNLYAFCGGDIANGIDPLGTKSNVIIPGTRYVGRVEISPDQKIPDVWHVDVEMPKKRGKVWSGKFDASGDYVGEREGFKKSDIANGDFEAVKRWAGPKIRKQAGALPPQSRPPIKGSGRCGSGPARGGSGPARGGSGPARGGSGGGVGGGYGQFLSPYLLL